MVDPEILDAAQTLYCWRARIRTTMSELGLDRLTEDWAAVKLLPGAIPSSALVSPGEVQQLALRIGQATLGCDAPELICQLAIVLLGGG
jgi:hypothetical protein